MSRIRARPRTSNYSKARARTSLRVPIPGASFGLWVNSSKVLTIWQPSREASRFLGQPERRRTIRTIKRQRKRRRCWCVPARSEEHTSELQSLAYLVCRLLLEKKKMLTCPEQFFTLGRRVPIQDVDPA